MKMEWRAAGGSTYTTLADEAGGSLGERVSGYGASVQRTVQVDELAFGAAPAVNDRGNARWKLVFGVEREHGDAGAALEFVATHAAGFPAIGNVDLAITVGSTVVLMSGCALTGLTPRGVSDRSSFCEYEFIGPTYVKQVSV